MMFPSPPINDDDLEDLPLSDHEQYPIAVAVNNTDHAGDVDDVGAGSPASPAYSSATDYYSSSSSFTDLAFTPSPSSQAAAGDDFFAAAADLSDDVAALTFEYIQIAVSDPQTHIEPGGAGATFVSFLITTQTLSRPSEISVRRRFRDVDALADRLSDVYRGFFVPVRPEKSVAEGLLMMDVDALERWFVAVEKYLWRLAAHPVIGKGEELRVFLQFDGELLWSTGNRVLDGSARLPDLIFGDKAGQVSGQDVGGRATKGGRELMRVFKELKQVVVNEFGGAKAWLMEEDEVFLERKDRMQDFEHALVQASLQAEALVNAQQDIGETLEEMGLAFIKLSKFENDRAMYYSQIICSGDSKLVATAAVKASNLYQELNVQTVKYLDALHEYLELMIAVKNAFSDRAGVLLTVQTLMSDLSSLQMKREKLEAASPRKFDESRHQKLEELNETIRATEDTKDCAIREFEKIKENNRTELKRLDKERREDFLSMLKGFALNQGTYADKIANAWVIVSEETSGYARR